MGLSTYFGFLIIALECGFLAFVLSDQIDKAEARMTQRLERIEKKGA